MIFNFEEIYKTFEKLKEIHDFKEYLDEIQKNNEILYTEPFDSQKALEQIHELTGKYRTELNVFAYMQNNGMCVSNQVTYQTNEHIINNLQYINNLIPLFALERKAITSYLKQQTQRGNING
ncbi:MAG: hypothetical protein HDT22_04975 [Ruminococcus sp.]|nr:hypothetical protein [Ruminococcus sp.]